jgi:hypothetical protein
VIAYSVHANRITLDAPTTALYCDSLAVRREVHQDARLLSKALGRGVDVHDCNGLTLIAWVGGASC